MKTLFIYPLFPTSFWSFEKAVEGVGKKAFMPPLGLITVAALLPQEWEFRLRDKNIEEVSEEDWDWADLVMFSGMIAQKDDFLGTIEEAKKRGKRVVVGGPYATSLPKDMLGAGADFLVLDEEEYTIPLFLEGLKHGETNGIYRSKEKPDVSLSPIPRYDLLDMDAYFSMALQYSRGCPFRCEFCDIIILYGRVPRTKSADQVKKELDILLELGWSGGVFFVDDNFIGNKRTVKPFLEELVEWQEENGYPFSFTTEASIDMAHDDELLDLMVRSKFTTVFIGIETPDTESLSLTLKHQNNRAPMSESLEKIARKGIRTTGGFIIGFDGEKSGAGQRVFDFAMENSIPSVTFSMLQALPGTALWDRLKDEGRLLDNANLNQTTLLNFEPSRPIEEVAEEYIEGFWKLYEPKNFLKRTYEHFRRIGTAEVHNDPVMREATKNRHSKSIFNWAYAVCFFNLVFKQGLVRNTRVVFWKYLYGMWKHNRGGIVSYLSYCLFFEHFYAYRTMVKDDIQHQLELRKTGKVAFTDPNIELSEEQASEVEWYKAS